MKKKILLLIAVLALLALSACSPKNGLTISDAWARPGLADGNSAVFFVIDNPEKGEDSLLSADSDVAAAVELHKTIMVEGNMTMQRQDIVPVPAREQVVFMPGDLHVMLIGLHEDLAVGLIPQALLGQHCLFGGVHAADRRAVGVFLVARADALEPGDPLGRFVVGWSQDHTLGRA